MYEQFKNEFLTNLAVCNINLKRDQIDAVLKSMDEAANGFDIYESKLPGLFALNDAGIPAAIYEYIECKKTEGCAFGTIYNYKNTLEIFFRAVKKSPDHVDAQDVRLFLQKYSEAKGITNRTLDKYREYILRFFTWCHDMGYIQKNIGKQCKPIHYEAKERQYLTTYELEQVRMACINAREKAIVEVLYSTACRVSELVNMKLTDIDWLNNTVHIFGKGSKHRTSFLNARARIALEYYLRYRDGDSEYIFLSDRAPHQPLKREAVEKIMRQIVARTTITKTCTPHTLRHTTATLALHNGMPIEIVSKLLGHSKLETTAIYARTMYEDLKMAHDKYVV